MFVVITLQLPIFIYLFLFINFTLFFSRMLFLNIYYEYLTLANDFLCGFRNEVP